jgi:hypothetical protein
MKLAVAIATLCALGGSAAAQDIRVEGGGGTLAPGVEGVVTAAGPEFQKCAAEHGARYVGGQAWVSVSVGTDGRKKDAWVAESDLGSWAVEKCLVHVARTLPFGAARGGDVTVSVPVAFQPASEPAPMAQAEQNDALKKIQVVRRCGKLAKMTELTFYVGPGGQVLSVGFQRPPSEKWADCAAEALRNVVMTDPRGQVVKATVAP